MSTHFIQRNGMWMSFTEIVDDLEVRVSLNDKKTIAKTDYADLIKFHHTLGTWIRNSYGLWAGNPLTANWINNHSSHVLVADANGCKVDESQDHPDVVSLRLIEELHSRVQYLNKP